jgi:hypothetical protein
MITLNETRLKDGRRHTYQPIIRITGAHKKSRWAWLIADDPCPEYSRLDRLNGLGHPMPVRRVAAAPLRFRLTRTHLVFGLVVAAGALAGLAIALMQRVLA